jgi:hypothetical protein
MSTQTTIPAIYSSLAAVVVEVDKLGISKTSQNTQQNYKYRGIDAVLDTFSSLFASNKILLRPSYSDHAIVEFTTKNGVSRMATVNGTFELVSLVDGSSYTIGPFPGEAGDSYDKATSKAMSVSLRNALLQTFVCPLGPASDPEASDDPTQPNTPGTPIKPQPTTTKAPAKGKAAKAPKGKARAGDAPSIQVTGSQLNVLRIKLRHAGMDEDTALAEFGSITPANLAEVVARLEEKAGI